MSIDNVQDITPRIQYVATGGQTIFPYPFPIFDDGDLVVDIDGTVSVITADYTVSGAGDDNGGNVTLTAGATAGQIVTIYRDIPIERDTDFQQNGPWRSAAINDELDRMTLVDQQLELATTRALRVNVNDEADFDDLILPSASSRASRFLVFDANGNPTVSEGTGSDAGLREDIATGAAGAVTFVDTVADMKALTGLADGAIVITGSHTSGAYGSAKYRASTAVVAENAPRIINNNAATISFYLLDELFLATQAGAIGDGVTSNTAAFDAASASIIGPVLVPPGGVYDYGGSTAFAYSLGLWDIQTSTDTPYDSFLIQRQVSSLGGSSTQVGGIIVRDTVNSGVTHNEFGYFSVLNSYSTSTAVEHVGVYSQATSLTTAASALWGGVFEVRNTTPTGGGTSVDHVLCGIEVDVVNAKAFSDTNKKIGVECIAYGGGESTEAFSLYAASNTRGNGSYNSGHWRYGLRMLGNSLDGTSGVGVQILSGNGTGIQIVGASANYGIHLNADAASPIGIEIASNYTTPIVVQANKKIKLNGSAGTQGISWDSTSSTIVLDGASIGVANHTTSNSATAGGTQATPASVTGYLVVYVNGAQKKVPYYNI